MDQIPTNRFFFNGEGNEVFRSKRSIWPTQDYNGEYVLSHIQDTVVEMDDSVTEKVKSASSLFFHLVVYLFFIHRALIHL